MLAGSKEGNAWRAVFRVMKTEIFFFPSKLWQTRPCVDQQQMIRDYDLVADGEGEGGVRECRTNVFIQSMFTLTALFTLIHINVNK